jgi:Zn-dependent M16 (insulinase) family peptidase
MIYTWLKASEMSVKYVLDENFFKHYYNDPISRACVYHAGCLLSQFRLKQIPMNVSGAKPATPAQPTNPGRPKTRKVENFSKTDHSDLKKTTLAINVLPTQTQDSQKQLKQQKQAGFVKH